MWLNFLSFFKKVCGGLSGWEVNILAKTEGILLDPVYSGKGMAGLIDLIRKGHFAKDQNVVFLHTGGSVALFGYPDALGLDASPPSKRLLH